MENILISRLGSGIKNDATVVEINGKHFIHFNIS